MISPLELIEQAVTNPVGPTLVEKDWGNGLLPTMRELRSTSFPFWRTNARMMLESAFDETPVILARR